MNLFDANELIRAELMFGENNFEDAAELLASMISVMESEMGDTYEGSADTQYFVFPSSFQQMVYRRIEKDPRHITILSQPVDRLYYDYSVALGRLGRIEDMVGPLQQAIRWNPVECTYRLQLASVCLSQGDDEEFLKLSYSVFARAWRTEDLAAAYTNFAKGYLDAKMETEAVSAIICGLRLSPKNQQLRGLAAEIAGETINPEALMEGFDGASDVLAEQGLPNGANLEVVLCALTSEYASRASGNEEEAIAYRAIAVGLVGVEPAKELYKLVVQEESGE